MTDELEQDAVEEVAEQPEGEPKKTDGKQDKAAVKKFTDAEMATLRRNKDKELTTAREGWETEKATLQETITGQEATIKKVVELLRKDVELDDDVMELLDEKSASEQLEFLLKKAEKANKQDIPRTPHGDGKRTQKFTFKQTNVV